MKEHFHLVNMADQTPFVGFVGIHVPTGNGLVRSSLADLLSPPTVDGNKRKAYEK